MEKTSLTSEKSKTKAMKEILELISLAITAILGFLAGWHLMKMYYNYRKKRKS